MDRKEIPDQNLPEQEIESSEKLLPLNDNRRENSTIEEGETVKKTDVTTPDEIYEVRNRVEGSYPKEINVEAVIAAIEKANEILDDDFVDLRSPYARHFIGAVEENFVSWGESLFRLAQETTGEKRYRYSTKLEDLEFLSPRGEYESFLRTHLFTTKEAIRELVLKGLAEAGYKDPIRELSIRTMKKDYSFYGPFSKPLAVVSSFIQRLMGFLGLD